MMAAPARKDEVRSSHPAFSSASTLNFAVNGNAWNAAMAALAWSSLEGSRCAAASATLRMRSVASSAARRSSFAASLSSPLRCLRASLEAARISARAASISAVAFSREPRNCEDGHFARRGASNSSRASTPSVSAFPSALVAASAAAASSRARVRASTATQSLVRRASTNSSSSPPPEPPPPLPLPPADAAADVDDDAEGLAIPSAEPAGASAAEVLAAPAFEAVAAGAAAAVASRGTASRPSGLAVLPEDVAGALAAAVLADLGPFGRFKKPRLRAPAPPEEAAEEDVAAAPPPA
eukprot:CAMPEP_0115476250 /NCGR_PEP_ID=MMETSP0271-20121206/55037_1 /TAXON_ID=71861 /ORGANISM="Scrippsiella trochoidea, Strain CCMP3099" /LENGTH=295 /DNA_ID=CAMNT_0002903651 /DNA_START=102 /DNA_END=989 /DNA_ORIENTATION=-